MLAASKTESGAKLITSKPGTTIIPTRIMIITISRARNLR
jgi:hypothetical protein